MVELLLSRTSSEITMAHVNKDFWRRLICNGESDSISQHLQQRWHMVFIMHAAPIWMRALICPKSLPRILMYTYIAVRCTCDAKTLFPYDECHAPDVLRSLYMIPVKAHCLSSIWQERRCCQYTPSLIFLKKASKRMFLTAQGVFTECFHDGDSWRVVTNAITSQP